MPVLFWLFLSGRRSKQDLLITNLQSQVDALGPEITAIEERCGLRRPYQPSQTIGIQYSVLSQIHMVVDLIARPHDLAPVHEVITGEHSSSLINLIAQYQLQGRQNRKLIRTA